MKTIFVSHPDGRLSSMRLLQTEDLRHHVVCGGVKQDPARGQPHHHVTAHGGQTDRDGVGTCGGKDVKMCRGSPVQSREIMREIAPNLLV